MHYSFPVAVLRILFVIALLHGACLVNVTAEQPGGATSLKARGFHAVPLQYKDFKFRVEAKLNGSKCTTGVDTGAPITMIDASRIKKARRIDPNRDHYSDPLFHDALERLSGYHTNFFILETLDFPGIQFLNTPAAPSNAEIRIIGEHVSSRRKHRTLDSKSLILGADFLTRHRAILSCLNPPYLLLQATTAATNTESLHRQLTASGYQTIAMEYKLYSWVVPVEIEGIKVNLVLDTGAPVNVVDPALVKGLKLEDGKSVGRIVGLDGRGSAADWHYLQSFRISGIEYEKMETLASDLKNWGFGTGAQGDAVGLLGMNFLAESRAIIDCGNHRLYLLPPARVEMPR